LRADYTAWKAEATDRATVIAHEAAAV